MPWCIVAADIVAAASCKFVTRLAHINVQTPAV